MDWIRDLFGWFKPSGRERVPEADGKLPYRMKGGPYAGLTIRLTAGVNSTLAVYSNRWRGRYVKATSHTYIWKEEQ